MRFLRSKIFLFIILSLIFAASSAIFLSFNSLPSRTENNLITSNTAELKIEKIEPGVAKINYRNGEKKLNTGKIFNTISENVLMNIEESKIAKKGETEEDSGNSKNNAEGQPAILSNYEQQVLALINDIRILNGLMELKATKTLTSIARLRSSDMLERNYFSHYNLDGHNVFDILKKNKIFYKNAGENLAHSKPASAGTPQAFMDTWIKSPTHRANILKDAYRSIGISVVENSGRRVLTTVFIN